MYKQISSKQWTAINIIESKLGVKFSGRSQGAAGAFIGKYMKLSMACSGKGELTNESASVLLFK
jgi:hypothetical protein